MTKLFQKVLSILCVIALLVSGIAMAFADEANEAPVADEAAQQTSDDEAARIAAEQEEAACKAAEEEAARKAAEEEAARKAAEEEAARKAAEEEAARKAAEEEAARKAAEEEAARKAAEEEAARKAAEEEAARKAAEEEAARKAAEEEAARKAAEEAEAARIAAEEAAQQAEETTEEDETDENGYIEIDDGWGYVDPDVISENTPEITDELKGIRNATMNVNEMLTDSLTFGEELVITLKCGDASSVLLNLYTAGSAIGVKLDGKTVVFYADNSDDPAYEMTSYFLENTAGHSYKITLFTNDAASFKLAAVAEQTEVQEVTPGTEMSGAIKNTNEEPAPSEDINNEVIPVTNENNSENAENTENTEASQTTETTETTENTAGTENNNEVTIEPIVPVEPAEPTIQVSMKTYSALKVGNSISDNLLGGQKAKFQVKCGKNDNVKLVLNANPDDLTIKIDGTDAAFVQDAEGTYSIELNDVAFRKFTIILSAKQDLAFSLSAEASEQVAVESKEETEEDNSEEDINKEETESVDGQTAEETVDETAEAVTDETVEGETAEEENTEKNEDNVTEETEASEEDAEAAEEEAEGTEEEAVEEIVDEEKEKMTALGYTKVIVTAEEGADLYAETSKKSEVVGHLDAGTEVWVILTEDQTFGQIYSEDEEATAQFISMEDAEVVAIEKADEAEETEEPEDLTDEQLIELGYRKVQVQNVNGADIYNKADDVATVIGHADYESELWIKSTEAKGWAEIYSEEETKQFVRIDEITKLTDEQMLAMGYIKVYVATDIGANIYGSLESEEAIDHLDVGTELWVKLIDGADRAQIYDSDAEATLKYISLVDIVATKKPEGVEELPTRELSVKSSVEDVPVINAGTIVTFDTELINFLEDDHYTVQWKYSIDGEEFIDIEDANDLKYEFAIDTTNAKYIWKVCVTLVTTEE